MEPTICVKCDNALIKSRTWYDHHCTAFEVYKKGEVYNYVLGRIEGGGVKHCNEINVDGKCIHFKKASAIRRLYNEIKSFRF